MQWWLDKDEEKALKEANEQFRKIDAWEEPIESWVRQRPPGGFTIGEVLGGALNLAMERQSGPMASRAIGILQRLGCLKVKRRWLPGEGPTWRWYLPGGREVWDE